MDDDLIPELKAWNNGNGIDLDDYLACLGNYELAIAFANFFWPTFVEYDDCILLNTPDAKKYADWKAATDSNKASIESLLNHRHIVDLFPNVERAPTLKQIVYIGSYIQQVWDSKLKRDFPDRDIVVEFLGEQGDDLIEYQVTFYQPQHSKPDG